MTQFRHFTNDSDIHITLNSDHIVHYSILHEEDGDVSVFFTLSNESEVYIDIDPIEVHQWLPEFRKFESTVGNIEGVNKNHVMYCEGVVGGSLGSLTSLVLSNGVSFVVKGSYAEVSAWLMEE